MKCDVYAHDWGVILPCKSGVIWEQQTDGVSCNHVEIEGVFIPLHIPRDENGEHLPELLAQANYKTGPYSQVSDALIWKEIKERMHFDFEELYPTTEPRSSEGFQWIKLTKFEPGWGHNEWVSDLVGKTLILIYPNSD